MSDYLRVSAVAERLGVSGETVRRFVMQGRLPGSRKQDPTKRTSPMLIPVDSVETLERALREPISVGYFKPIIEQLLGGDNV